MESGDAGGEASGTDGESDDGEAGGSSVEGEEHAHEIPKDGDHGDSDGHQSDAVDGSPDTPDDVNDFDDDGTTLVLGGADGESPGADVARVSDVEERCDLGGIVVSRMFGENMNN